MPSEKRVISGIDARSPGEDFIPRRGFGPIRAALISSRTLRATKGCETPGTSIGTRETAERGCNRHVTRDRVRHRALLHHLRRGRADSGVGEVDRNANPRRIAVLSRKARVERTGAELVLTDQYVVCQPRRVEPESVGIVDAEIGIE